MNAHARFLASAIATLSAAGAFADVRPFPAPGYPSPGPGRPFPTPGYPAPGPSRPFPVPGYPSPGPRPAPLPPPGYPDPRGPRDYPPPPAMESIECRDLRGGYDSLTITTDRYSRGGYIVDLNVGHISAYGLEASVVSRYYDGMLLRFESPYGPSQINLGYMNHPYGPTASIAMSGGYRQEFRCHFVRPYPNRPYP